MDVKKIFMTLVIVVMCIILGAFLLNKLVPTATAQVVNAVEDSLYNATGMKFDFNSDGIYGGTSKGNFGDQKGDAMDASTAGGVDGFNKAE